MSALGDVAVGVVARGLWDQDNAGMSSEWRDMAWADMGGSEPSEERAESETRAAAALASLDSPEVVQGIAEVLAEHQSDRYTERCICHGWSSPEVDYAGRLDAFTRHQAQALVAALGGRADR